MQESFDILSSSGRYCVYISTDSNFKDEVLNPNTIILADERILAHLPESFKQSIITISAEETNKSLENIPPILNRLRQLGANRESEIIAIGGGIIQDVATFVSSIYMRGVKWDYYPTTLLGMVDSCIGGKSSINVGQYKNLIGNFFPPQKIVVELSFLNSLNSEQIISGLCEAVKICYARGESEFEKYLDSSPSANLSETQFGEIILLSLKAKKWFIEVDEYDQKERLLLNFGHTFGHAIESATLFRIPHGIAVGLGMLIGIDYSMCRQLLSFYGEKRCERLREYLLSLIIISPETFALLKQIDSEELMEKFDGDKKHSKDHYRMIIPIAEGELVLHSVYKDSFNRNELMNIVRKSILNTLAIWSKSMKSF